MFLLGHGERDGPCSEVILEHGDLCILDGQDRSAFHAVPRVMDFKSDNVDNIPPSLADKPLENYLSQSRINISLRQVTKNY